MNAILARSAAVLSPAFLLVLAGGCGDDPAAPSPSLPPPPPAPAPDPCPADLTAPTGPIDGHWQGWWDGATFLLRLESADGRSVTGEGDLVGMAWTAAVEGDLRDDSLEISIRLRERAVSLEFTGRRGEDVLCGHVRGRLPGGAFVPDSAMKLHRLPPGHSALTERAWDLVTPTPVPESVSGIHVRGDVWVVPALRDGLFVSRDRGATWSRPFGGVVHRDGVAFHPEDPDRIAVGRSGELLVSEDGGRTWSVRATFPHGTAAIHVSPDGTLWYAPSWPPGEVPGIYRSEGWSGPFHFLPYGEWEGEMILTWEIGEAPWSGTLLLSSEIADHPRPYDPPFLRSGDRGESWTDESSRWKWHSIATEFDAANRHILNLLEGPGLWVSDDDGRRWDLASRVFGLSLLFDPDSSRVLVGNLPTGLIHGGAFLSRDGGRIFEHAGLEGKIVADFGRDREGRILAAVLGDGIYRMRERR